MPATRLGPFRRYPRASPDWFQRHWLGLILLAQLGLTTVFIVFAATYGFTGSTFFFGALAAYNLVALLFRFFFVDPGRFAAAPMMRDQIEGSRTGATTANNGEALREQSVLPSDYRIVSGPPSIDDYLMLRTRTGLALRARKQAEVAVGGRVDRRPCRRDHIGSLRRHGSSYR